LSRASGMTGSKEVLDVLDDCKGKLETIQGLLGSMDQLLQQEPSHKREVWKQKVSNQRDEYISLQRAWAKDYARHGGHSQYEDERAALLGNRYPGTGAGAAPGKGGPLDPESQRALDRSHQAIDDLEQRGMAMLGSLANQRERLKGVHKKVLDVMNTLGVSNSLIRVIEKRQSTDVVLMLVCSGEGGREGNRQREGGREGERVCMYVSFGARIKIGPFFFLVFSFSSYFSCFPCALSDPPIPSPGSTHPVLFVCCFPIASFPPFFPNPCPLLPPSPQFGKLPTSPLRHEYYARTRSYAGGDARDGCGLGLHLDLPPSEAALAPGRGGAYSSKEA
jgi:Golgi SNAP receptor complex protein 2